MERGRVGGRKENRKEDRQGETKGSKKEVSVLLWRKDYEIFQEPESHSKYPKTQFEHEIYLQCFILQGRNGTHNITKTF